MEPSEYLSMPQNQPHLKVMAVLRRWDPIGVISEWNQDDTAASVIFRLVLGQESDFRESETP